jgi:hypothetical protein
MIRDKAIQRFAWFFVLLLLLFLFASGKGFAEKSVTDTSLVRTSSVRIDCKNRNTITVGERHFEVTRDTLIKDAQNQEISFTLLSVPCEAEIQYELRMDRDPLCLSINIKRQLSTSEKLRSTSVLER